MAGAAGRRPTGADVCDGRTALWPVAENRHKDGILDLSIIPARIPAALATQVRNAALTIAEALAYQGVLCVEFFVDENGRLLVNEFAPRPHNSGHGTLDASQTSQFEQPVRTLAGLPLGDNTMRSPVVMQNPAWRLVGRRNATVASPACGFDATLHLYGKAKPRSGRKMGHFSCIAATVEEALDAALRLRLRLRHQLPTSAHTGLPADIAARRRFNAGKTNADENAGAR